MAVSAGVPWSRAEEEDGSHVLFFHPSGGVWILSWHQELCAGTGVPMEVALTEQLNLNHHGNHPVEDKDLAGGWEESSLSLCA